MLAALGEHLTNAEIAERLSLSIRTVESHVSSLLRKYAVDNRRALAAIAARSGRESAGTLAGLPSAWTSFVGRQRELAAVRAALGEARLVTLVGPGGVGKTRLATVVVETVVGEAAAAEFPAGGAFVDLVPVGGGFVSQAVASVLGITERPQQSLDDAVLERLRWGRSLVVLDNCEHLLDAVARFAGRVLAGCPEVTVLATSRERLALAGERVIRVPPLSLASEMTGGVSGSEAEALFLDRAGAIAPDVATDADLVGVLCARLDGIPLAIELAAARIGSLGADGLVAGLDDRLRILTGGRTPADRHRSLRGVLDWSYDLLDDDERALFRRLGVYAGGFDRDAAAAVAGEPTPVQTADLVARLADKSLLVHHATAAGSRWGMLETVRAYAVEQLVASGERATVDEHHLRWAGATAAELERRLEADQPWLTEFDPVADDLRAALDRAPAGPGAEAVAHRLARAIGHLAYARRFLGEARLHYERATDRAPDAASAAADLRAAADVACAAGRYADSFDLLLASAGRAEAAGDDLHRAIALADAVMIACRFAGGFSAEVPHERLSALLDEAGRAAPADHPRARAHVAAAAAWNIQPDKLIPDADASDAALAAARVADDPVLISGVLDAVLSVAAIGGASRRAFQLSRERLELLERLPRHEPRAGPEILDTFQMAAKHALMAGALPDALATAELGRGDPIGGAEPHINTSRLVVPLVLQGRFPEALDAAGEMRDSWERAGAPTARWMAPSAYAIVLLHGLRGDADSARRWAAFARQVLGTDDLATSRNLMRFVTFVDARVAMHAGRVEAASALAREAVGEPGSWYVGPRWDYDGYVWALVAELAVLAGAPDAAARLADAAPAGEQNDWAAACLARAHGRLHDDRSALEHSVAGWEKINARYERACTLLLLDDRAAEGRAELAALDCPLPAD